MTETVKIYVPLLEEGTPTVRPTQAIPLGNDLYKILATPDYDPESEIWEFLPGSVVKCDVATDFRTNENFLRAHAMVGPDGKLILSKEVFRD